MYGLIALAALLALVFTRKVKVKPGSRGFNNIFGFDVPPAIDTFAAGQSPAGRLAHEKVEFRFAWIAGILCAIPFAVLTPAPLTFASPVVALAANGILRIFTQSWDPIGHNVEIMVAEDEGWPDYRTSEIRRLTDWAGAFEDKDARLRRWEWLAKIAIKLK